MHLTCPHCQAHYELDSDIQPTALLCHRCGHEFPQQNSPSEATINTEQQHPDTLESTAPQRQSSHILPWFMVMLSLIAASGFWFQYDAWMDKRWLRSGIINLGFNLTARDKDWLIVAGSVQPAWIIRPDGSKAFTIKGQVKNLLSSPMPPPRFEIVFFSKTNPDQRLATQMLDFTQTPSEQAMQQPDDQTPYIDNKAIAGLTSRQFIFLIDSLPPNSGDFSITARHR
ncbi:MAG: hypothetical protein Q9M16_04330 [Mariprofundus sp.]|nr:hypothetical protein [Mariprofundus sp.]